MEKLRRRIADQDRYIRISRKRYRELLQAEKQNNIQMEVARLVSKHSSDFLPAELAEKYIEMLEQMEVGE